MVNFIYRDFSNKIEGKQFFKDFSYKIERDFISNFKGISLINLKAGNFLKDFSFKIEKGFSFLNCQICPKTIFERFGTITEFAQKPYLRESEPYANLPKTIFDF